MVNPNEFSLWHNRFGHSGTEVMHKIIEHTRGNPLKNFKMLLNKKYKYETCSLSKLIIRPFKLKVDIESPSFFQRIQGDICGPIHPHTRPFR